MVSVSLLISFMMTLLAMHAAVIERTREIGILKSLGASKTFILQLIVNESLLISLLGLALGLLLTAISFKLILAAFPTLPVHIPAGWRLTAALIASGGGILGALYPALKAVRLDPIEALSYE